jgi:threonylcarbamoyladenosine tRNA methylthiotransferase MtaB
MPDQIPVHVARERNRVLRDLAADKNLGFRRKFVGKTLEVITLQQCDDDWTEALSGNYLKVRLAGRHEANQILTAEISEVVDEELVAVAKEEVALSI